MNIFQAFELVPKILEIVYKIEALVPIPEQGKEKLDFVLELVKQVFELVPGVGAADSKTTAIITVVVKLAVGLFNKTGAFGLLRPKPEPAA